MHDKEESAGDYNHVKTNQPRCRSLSVNEKITAGVQLKIGGFLVNRKFTPKVESARSYSELNSGNHDDVKLKKKCVNEGQFTTPKTSRRWSISNCPSNGVGSIRRYLKSRKASFDVGNLPIDGRVESPESMADENHYNLCRQGGQNDQLMCSSLAKIDDKATSHN